MLLTVFLFLCPVPQMADTPKAVSDAPAAAIGSQPTGSSLSSDLPSAPAPQLGADVKEVSISAPAPLPLLNAASSTAGLILPFAEPILPRSAGAPPPPAKAL